MGEQTMPAERHLASYRWILPGFRDRSRLAVRKIPGILRGKEGLLFAIGLVLLWQAVARFSTGQHRFLFPSPAVTAKALWASLPELLIGTWHSFLILVPGYLLAVFTGIFWGILVGTTGWLHRAFNPFAKVAAPIPPTIYIPYAIALLSTFALRQFSSSSSGHSGPFSSIPHPERWRYRAGTGTTPPFSACPEWSTFGGSSFPLLFPTAFRAWAWAWRCPSYCSPWRSFSAQMPGLAGLSSTMRISRIIQKWLPVSFIPA